ncbi:cytochrome P450 [Novosphingobium flavum]|uniref:Cytochrome P450 n=2 Tax=Novosphingobium flavum TaxID=1778672 RepID=A0A7X1FRM2_9SPHN|nr:cytochrome P450 [Novosphingobium flavum]
MSVASGVPVSDVDLFSEEVISDPYRAYSNFRSLGPVVWLTQCSCYFLTRFSEIHAALGDWKTFTSAQGVTLNDQMNAALRGGVLCSDPPEHDAIRKVLIKPLMPNALRDLSDKITSEAEGLVDRLVAKGSFDAATELAQHLPVTIVSDLVGLPEEGREKMLEWAAANFQCFGPLNDRTLAAFPTAQGMVDYAFTQCVPGKLKPGGWASMIWDAADRGEISHDQCGPMMNDYMGPSLDTTIFATSSAVWLFAQNPDQWDILCANPQLIPNAVNEVIRVESPIQNFSRVLTRDFSVGGAVLPAGSRIIVSYGCANRDPDKWAAPDRFDVRRRAMDHVGFGHGVHRCIGNNLARMEIAALLTALTKRVKRFKVVNAERHIINVLRGFKKLEVSVS